MNRLVSMMLLIFGFFLMAAISSATDECFLNNNPACIDIFLQGPCAATSNADVYLDQINYLGRTDNHGYLRAAVPPGYHILYATKYVPQTDRWYLGTGGVAFPVSVIRMTGPHISR
ncbi:MAG: hypothetical protein MUO26_07630 [Methanotrichaceae archaeon]|nr:hypothetical protein [Methanotrichaceae archaeon]